MNIQKSITGIFRRGLKSKLGNAIMEMLSKEGFRPEVEDDFILFKVEGTLFYFSLDDRDEFYARLVLPNFYEVTNENKVLALYNMNYLNFDYKFVKLYMKSDRVSVTVDMLFYPENMEKTVFRMLSIAWEAARDFCKEMDKGYEWKIICIFAHLFNDYLWNHSNIHLFFYSFVYRM